MAGGFRSDKAYAEGQNSGIESYTLGTSLTISDPDLSTTVAPGNIGYLATDVTYGAIDIAGYTLQVTYASNKTSLTNGNITLAGADGKTGAAMKSTDSNLWGFSWTTNSTTDYDDLTYYTMPPYNTKGTGLSTGRLESGTADIGSMTKTIVFAARFASNNMELGSYQTQVMLSLVTTPKNLSAAAANVGEIL